MPPQLDALSKDTQLVTMTIGGNDSSVFINTILQCGTAGLTTAGQGSPCKDKYGSSFQDTLRTKTYPDLVKTLKAVHAKAPTAKVAILATRGSCRRRSAASTRCRSPPATSPTCAASRPRSTTPYAGPPAATATTYVDLNRVSDNHDACKPIGTRWVEPVLQGTNPVIVHPNALGESQMAAQTVKVLGLR